MATQTSQYTDLCNKQGLTRVYDCSHQQVLAHHVEPPLSYLMAAKHISAPLFSLKYCLVRIGTPYDAPVFTIVALSQITSAVSLKFDL